MDQAPSRRLRPWERRGAVPYAPTEPRRFAGDPSRIDQRRLLVGERHERFLVDVVGADLAPSRLPIYVAPGIHPDPSPGRLGALGRGALRAVGAMFPTPLERALGGFLVVAAVWFVVFVLPQIPRVAAAAGAP